MKYDSIESMPAEKAWEQMKIASDEHDLDEFKIALQKYMKATPDATYVQLETAFRIQNFNFYFIALEKEIQETFSNMDLQGNLGKKYSISLRKSAKHQRPKEKELWPTSPEENLARLVDAGEPVYRGIPKCSNCEVLGHIAKACPEERQERTDRAEVKCFNCDEVGHRVRDCKCFKLLPSLHSALTLYQAPLNVLINLPAATAVSLVMAQRSAQSLVPPRELSVRSAVKLAISPRTAPKAVEVVEVVATVVSKPTFFS